MGHSSELGLVDFAASLYADDGDPVDQPLLKYGVANGLLHMGDSMAQVRVSVMHVDSAVANGQDAFDVIDSGIDTDDTWGLMGPYGRWPLTVHEDGDPYYLRVRIAGALSGTPATATYRVVIAPDYPSAVLSRDSSVDHTFEATTTSSTIGWLTGTTNGDDASTTRMRVDQSFASGWLSYPSAHNAVSGADERVLVGGQLAVSAWVFAKTSATALRPRMHALHLAEWSGPS